MAFPTVDTQLERLHVAVDTLLRQAGIAGIDAPVPTCPRWTVRGLLAHQGTVHRWAIASLRGQDFDIPAEKTASQQVSDPLVWLRQGADDLVRTLVEAPDDVEALVFLKNAPPPRSFWARRQVHETTIHAVDALAAVLGRFPTPDDIDWVDDQVALDGIDEILTGFVTRGRRYSAMPAFRVAVTGSDRAWSLAVGEDERVATTRETGPAPGHQRPAGGQRVTAGVVPGPVEPQQH